MIFDYQATGLLLVVSGILLVAKSLNDGGMEKARYELKDKRLKEIAPGDVWALG